jgi:hypothetical protein
MAVALYEVMDGYVFVQGYCPGILQGFGTGAIFPSLDLP